jgi:hypothetical protein
MRSTAAVISAAVGAFPTVLGISVTPNPLIREIQNWRRQNSGRPTPPPDPDRLDMDAGRDQVMPDSPAFKQFSEDVNKGRE